MTRKINVPTDNNRQKRLADALGDQLRDEIPAKVGNPATGEIFNSSDRRSNAYFVHGIGENTQSVYSATTTLPASETTLGFGTPVMVKRTKGGLVITSLDYQTYPVFSVGQARRHDQRYVRPSQILYGTAQPTAPISMKVLVPGAHYTLNGTRYRVADQLSADFSASPNDTSSTAINIPSNNTRAIGVLIQLDPTDGSLSYKQGSEFDSALSHASAYDAGLYPTRDAEHAHIAHVRLIAGMTAIDHAHVYNAPEFITIADLSPLTVQEYDGGTPSVSSVTTLEFGDTLVEDRGSNTAFVKVFSPLTVLRFTSETLELSASGSGVFTLRTSSRFNQIDPASDDYYGHATYIETSATNGYNVLLAPSVDAVGLWTGYITVDKDTEYGTVDHDPVFFYASNVDTGTEPVAATGRPIGAAVFQNAIDNSASIESFEDVAIFHFSIPLYRPLEFETDKQIWYMSAVNSEADKAVSCKMYCIVQWYSDFNSFSI